MKRILFLLTTLVAVAHWGNAQDRPHIDSRDEAIAILKNSEFFDILRNPTDTINNIDRFVSEINRIVSIDQQQSNRLKAQILSVLQKKEGFPQDWSLIYWPLGQFPFVGSNINHVLKANFSASDYARLSDQLSKNLGTAVSAYARLAESHKTKENWASIGFIDMPDYIKMIYEYFGI